MQNHLYDSYVNLLRGAITRLPFITDPKAYELRRLGQDWPGDAETMIGDVRLRNIQDLLEKTHAAQVLGNVAECGVWKGGATIFMNGVLRALNDNRSVFVCDSFQGLPKPNPEQYPVDKDDPHHTYKFLAVSEADVRKNFERFGLLDDFVHFVPGFFKDSLPGPIRTLSVLRVDADMYESTTQVLQALYRQIAPGGYLIIDDYYNIRGCHEAVEDFRKQNEITNEIVRVDWSAAYWQV